MRKDLRMSVLFLRPPGRIGRFRGRSLAEQMPGKTGGKKKKSQDHLLKDEDRGVNPDFVRKRKFFPRQ
jgi:hypothetical protein